MKKGKQDKQYFIVSLFVVILSLAVGYAVFAETINISGTASTTGEFDIEFFEAAATSQFNQSSLLTTNTAVISGDKNLLTLVVPSLERPDAYVEYDITVKNVGNIGARLESIDVTGDSDPDVVVTNTISSVGLVLAPGATETFKIKVEWVDASYVNGSDLVPQTLNFTIDLNYEQDY